MFREMRRKKQLLPQEDAIAILEKGTSGVLAVIGDDDYPYAVPISYLYHNFKIYFHGAKAGHKLDGIMKNNKVSFCVIDQDQIVPQKYTTYFRSVIVFGKAKIMTDEEEIRNAIDILAIKYSPEETDDSRKKAIEWDFKQLCMVEISIDHITGKEAIELVKKKNEICNNYT